MSILFRIDDIGASTKHFNQHGKKWFAIFGRPILYVPFANVWFFKRIWPFKQWAKYDELTAGEWKKMLGIFERHGIVPIIAVTATWVERDGTLTPFPKKFPEAAAVLKEAFLQEKIIIANHGLTHCIVGKHLPRFWSSNRKFHREFLPELDATIHRKHIIQSQEILERFFERSIHILVPPGNVWSNKTYHALAGTSLRTIMCNRYMMDSNETMEGAVFIDDAEGSIAFHDRELKLYGVKWLTQLIERYKV